jgi:flavin reductase ActVB
VIPPEDFRRVLGHFASGVTIVTTSDADGRPTGLTASAFTSVSLDPPLVLICVSHKSQSYPSLLERGCFAVNFLRREHEEMSRRFATTRLDKFQGVAYRMTPLGVPILEDALAHVECVTVNKHVEGDHTVFIGRVEGGGTTSGEPLLYYRGQYSRLGEV